MHEQKDRGIMKYLLPGHISKFAAAGCILLLCLLLPLATPADSKAETTQFKDTEIKMENDDYLVSTNILLFMPGTVIEALQHGVVLEIGTDLQVIEKISWWPDRVLHKNVIRRKLRYHIISEQYVVTDMTLRRQNSYYQLQQALRALGEVSWKIPETSIIGASGEVQVRVRSYLDVNQLPLLLQLVARTHPDWRKLTTAATRDMTLEL